MGHSGLEPRPSQCIRSCQLPQSLDQVHYRRLNHYSLLQLSSKTNLTLNSDPDDFNMDTPIVVADMTRQQHSSMLGIDCDDT